jgi:hypothetical protein
MTARRQTRGFRSYPSHWRPVLLHLLQAGHSWPHLMRRILTQDMNRCVNQMHQRSTYLQVWHPFLVFRCDLLLTLTVPAMSQDVDLRMHYSLSCPALVEEPPCSIESDSKERPPELHCQSYREISSLPKMTGAKFSMICPYEGEEGWGWRYQCYR